MPLRIFYSWQSDLPNRTNRGLIAEALTLAAEGLDAEVEIRRDTEGLSGSPDIAQAIFHQIDGADVFVADVSIVSSGALRSFINPNVGIELGYAAAELGWDRVLMVFNEGIWIAWRSAVLTSLTDD